MLKLVWKVSGKPTGRYRGFEQRSWPTADYAGIERPAVMLLCKSEYVPRLVKDGDHDPISVCIADYGNPEDHGSFKWHRLIAKAFTLKEAKELAQRFLEKHPEYLPTEVKGDGK